MSKKKFCIRSCLFRIESIGVITWAIIQNKINRVCIYSLPQAVILGIYYFIIIEKMGFLALTPLSMLMPQLVLLIRCLITENVVNSVYYFHLHISESYYNSMSYFYKIKIHAIYKWPFLCRMDMVIVFKSGRMYLQEQVNQNYIYFDCLH